VGRGADATSFIEGLTTKISNVLLLKEVVDLNTYANTMLTVFVVPALTLFFLFYISFAMKTPAADLCKEQQNE